MRHRHRRAAGHQRLVARASGRPVAAGKSIVGDAVFSHESGIHVDGLLKDRRNYENFAPEELGRTHRLVLGKHSGVPRVIDALCPARPGDRTPAQVRALLERIRAHVLPRPSARTHRRRTSIRFYLDLN